MRFFFKYPEGTDFLAGLQGFKSKTLKVKHVQDMHRHLFREKNTPEKNHSGVKI
jgi:ribosomal protein S21